MTAIVVIVAFHAGLFSGLLLPPVLRWTFHRRGRPIHRVLEYRCPRYGERYSSRPEGVALANFDSPYWVWPTWSPVDEQASRAHQPIEATQ